MTQLIKGATTHFCVHHPEGTQGDCEYCTVKKSPYTVVTKIDGKTIATMTLRDEDGNAVEREVRGGMSK